MLRRTGSRFSNLKENSFASKINYPNKTSLWLKGSAVAIIIQYLHLTQCPFKTSYFLGKFWPLLKTETFLGADGSLSKIGLCQNHPDMAHAVATIENALKLNFINRCISQELEGSIRLGLEPNRLPENFESNDWPAARRKNLWFYVGQQMSGETKERSWVTKYFDGKAEPTFLTF